MAFALFYIRLLAIWMVAPLAILWAYALPIMAAREIWSWL